jgi:hypothetical protein
MRSSSGRVPLKGFIQGAKLVSLLSGGVLILSVVLGRSPRYFSSGVGALTAVLLLVFRALISCEVVHAEAKRRRAECRASPSRASAEAGASGREVTTP